MALTSRALADRPDSSPPGAGRIRPADARAALTIYAVLLLLVPSTLVVKALGAAGAPATLYGLGLLLWWGCSRIMGYVPKARGYHPVHIGIGLFAAVVLLAYAHGNLHPLGGDELNAADRGILTVGSWSGVVLVGTDMMRCRQSVEILLKRIVVLGAVVAFVGFVQFTVGFNLAGLVQIPGLSPNGYIDAVWGGGAVRRVASTATHPIEFGMTLSLVLPLALHYAFVATRRRGWWWAMVVLIGVALPMSLSRSAILAVAAEFIVLFAVWPPRRRLGALAIAPVFIVGLRIMVPGLVGTIFSIFSNASSDPSIQGRADSRGAAGVLIKESPWLGRGFNTYIPSNFKELGLQGVNHGSFDNQYLGTLVEMGAIGLTALVVLLLVSMAVARGIRVRSTDPDLRELGQSFFASFLASAIGMATFDGFGFPMFTGLFMLLFGLSGALWRITRDEYDERRSQALVAPAVGDGVGG